MTPIHELIRALPSTPHNARGDWTGESERAKFEGAKVRDAARKVRRFGKRG